MTYSGPSIGDLRCGCCHAPYQPIDGEPYEWIRPAVSTCDHPAARVQEFGLDGYWRTVDPAPVRDNGRYRPFGVIRTRGRGRIEVES